MKKFKPGDLVKWKNANGYHSSIESAEGAFLIVLDAIQISETMKWGDDVVGLFDLDTGKRLDQHYYERGLVRVK